MRNRLSDEQGFTLIELLVVILIIGILAAIALPNFLGQRSRGQDASAKANARNAVSMVEACYTDNQNYASCMAPTAGSLGTNTGLQFVPGAPAADQVQVVGAGDGFTVTAKSKSGNTFSIVKAAGTGVITRPCGVPSADADRGACPTSELW